MKGTRQLDAAAPRAEVGSVESPDFVELSLQACLGSHREHCASVAISFCASHDDLEPLEIEILHAKVEAFVETQAGAVEEEPNEAMSPFELPQNSGDF